MNAYVFVKLAVEFTALSGLDSLADLCPAGDAVGIHNAIGHTIKVKRMDFTDATSGAAVYLLRPEPRSGGNIAIEANFFEVRNQN